MKKYTTLFAFLILSCGLYSQTKFGLTAGSAFSNRTQKDVSDLVAPLLPSESKVYLSFYIGGYAEFSISDLISISPELFFTRRGRVLTTNAYPDEITSINNDLALPVLIKFNLLRKKLQLYSGPEFSYVISRDAKGFTLNSTKSKSDFERSYDIAITAGASYQIIKNLYIDLRVNIGLIDQSKTYNIPGEFIGPAYVGQQIPVDYKAFNWSAQAGLKYCLDL